MSLADFERWLGDRLPDAAESLNPRADEDACRRFEEDIGLRLPEGFVALYRWHDGQACNCPTGIFYGMHFMSLQEVLVEWRFWADEAANAAPMAVAPTERVKQQPANRHWIPFAEDGSGNFLAIDLDPGPAGHAGQVINFGSDEDRHYVLARSVPDFISWLVNELHTGNHHIVDEGAGYSFNVLSPWSSHFLDAAETLFGNKKPRKAPTPATPPRDSTIGTFLFIRSELARQAPAGWRTISVEASISGKKSARKVELAHRCDLDGRTFDLRIDDANTLSNAFIELQDRTAEESWKWRRIKLDFGADDEHHFAADTD